MSVADIVGRYRDTMGLTREGAIRRMHELMDRIEDDAATITALQAEVERLKGEYICRCGLRVEPHRCSDTKGEF